jgi:hypothetical protein
MPELTEGQLKSEFIVSEANGTLSRESITVLSGQNLKPGHVLGKVLDGSATGAAVAGNTGNGTIGSVDANTSAKKGVYTLSCIEPASNGGTFSVEDPDGVTIGTAVVGTPYAGVIEFTIADGATDFVAGDRFTVTVAGVEKFKEYNPANTDGSQIAVALLLDYADATAADIPGVAIVRQAEVNAGELVWFTGATDNQKAAGLGYLQAVGIIAR